MAPDAGGANALADLALIAVGRGGVDMAIAEAQSLLDRGGGGVGRGLEDAKPDRRHLDAVVEGENWGRVGHPGLPLMRNARAPMSFLRRGNRR